MPAGPQAVDNDQRNAVQPQSRGLEFEVAWDFGFRFFLGFRVEDPGVDAQLVEILINTFWMELSLNETKEDEKLSSFTPVCRLLQSPNGGPPFPPPPPSPPSPLSSQPHPPQREPIHHQPHIVVVCCAVLRYDWMVGVDVAHPLERRWNASFCVVSTTQCSNRSDADDSRMLNKQLLHARQDSLRSHYPNDALHLERQFVACEIGPKKV